MRSVSMSSSLVKRLLAFVAALLLACVCTFALAADVPQEMESAEILETVIPAETEADNDLRFEYYVNGLFYPQAASSYGLNHGSRLTGKEAELYKRLKAGIEKIAAGESASAEFSFDMADFLDQMTFTAEDLGVDNLMENGAPSTETLTQIGQYVAIDTQALLDALLYDLPYELYWFDKASGMACSYPYRYSYYLDGSSIWITEGSYSFSLAVAEEYQASGTYTFNTALASTAKAAADNAKAVVAANVGNNDLTILKNYKNAICDYVSYNDDAANSNIAYGNPWQLVWVFDNDPDTNVVCEGYSKAFEYLCNQTNFAGNINAYCVSGTMQANSGSGPHMWNIVAMDDGANYLVDVTNCDTNAIGYPDRLFLAFAPAGTAGVSYSFYTSSGNVTYTYDDSVIDGFDAKDLIISNSSYTGNIKNVTISVENFPDDAFRAYVSEHLDTDSNGVLSVEEIGEVSSLQLSNMGISSLKGIEYFTNLTYLEALNNSLTEIDLSALEALNFLYLSHNQITSIDLTCLPLLDSLWLDFNPLTSIDLSKNPRLCNLQIDQTSITEIDVTANPILLTLNVQATGVKELDVSQNTQLVQLICQSCGLKELDVSKNTELTSLWTSDNELTQLDLSHNTKLEQLFCGSNHLAALDLSNNPLMTDLRGSANHILLGEATESYSLAQLPGFDGNRASNWRGATFDQASNMLTNINSNYVRYTYDCGNGMSMEFMLSFIDEAVPVNAEYFPDPAFRAYVSENLDADHDGFMTAEEMANVTDINVNDMDITTLKGIEYFCNLTNLRCSDNELTELVLSTNNLYNLFVSGNRLTSLDIGTQNILGYLDVSDNLLTELDLSAFPQLDVLYCGYNQMTQLDVPEREWIDCVLGTQYASKTLVINRDNAGYTIDLSPLGLDLNRVKVTNDGYREVAPGVAGFDYQPHELVYTWDTGLEGVEMQVACKLSRLLDVLEPFPETTEGTGAAVTAIVSCAHVHPEFLLFDGTSVLSHHACIDNGVSMVLPGKEPGIQEYTIAATDGIPCRVSFTVITHAQDQLVLPAQLKTIGEEAFMGVDATEIIVPEGVTAIEGKAFANCDGLALITLPDSLETMDAAAFDGCDEVVVLCSEGSAAQRFAQENGIAVLAR